MLFSLLAFHHLAGAETTTVPAPTSSSCTIPSGASLAFSSNATGGLGFSNAEDTGSFVFQYRVNVAQVRCVLLDNVVSSREGITRLVPMPMSL